MRMDVEREDGSMIKGTLEDIIYRNEINGYMVGLVETDEEMATIVGSFTEVKIGEMLELEGEWIQHPKFGRQFSVTAYKSVVPTSIQGIESYLASGLIPGIGPKMAKKIVDTFGAETMNILQSNPERIKEVSGIGDKKANGIMEAFMSQIELRNIMVFLQQYGISTNFAVRIYRRYESETIEKLRENPYRLADEIQGIGFKKADEIAKKMGVEPASEFRIYSGLKHILLKMALEGFVCIPQGLLLARGLELLEVEEVYVQSGIMNMATTDKIQIETMGDEVFVYLMGLYNAETGIAAKLVELSMARLEPLKADVESFIESFQKKFDIEYAEKQKTAIRTAAEEGVLVITGGPGTGKTTTINSIIQMFEACEQKVVLAAPTGRAAKRMTEATDKEAKTIHRLLEYAYAEDELAMVFNKNEEEPLETDVIIIDEMSMVDTTLMYHLLQAIKTGTRVVLVGDVDQLPSVGPGNVLRDIIESDFLPVVILDEIFRQAEESMIVVNAHRINKGTAPLLNVKDKDFYFVPQTEDKEIAETIVDLCHRRLPKFNGFDSMRDIQVLAPMKKGEAGVLALNKKLQDMLNAKGIKEEVQFQKHVYRLGDKVMQVKNNYKLKWEMVENGRRTGEGEGVFNGDIGYITRIDTDANEVIVCFDDCRFVTYDHVTMADEVTLAYAITIHKSQGSEFPVVVIPITWGPPMLLTRNLIYTAITRAKHLVVLVGQEKFLQHMVANSRIEKRYSGLKYRLERVKEIYQLD